MPSLSVLAPRNAQLAGRASVELHTLIFFRGRQVVADARVTKVRLGACVQGTLYGRQPAQLAPHALQHMFS